jgi:hypothetical protein
MRKRHVKKKVIPRDFFETVEEWDSFVLKMRPGTFATVRNGKLFVGKFTYNFGQLKDV